MRKEGGKAKEGGRKGGERKGERTRISSTSQ